MKKKYQITAAVFAVVICTLLGCERKEKETGEFLLPVQQGEDVFAPGENQGMSDEHDREVFESAETDSASEDAPGSVSSASQTSSESAVSADLPARANVDMPALFDSADTDIGSCAVHVCGAVKEPGVYLLKADERIYQAIEMAGGFAQNADENYLNQADILIDGMKIYVPTKEETAGADVRVEWKISGSPGTEAADKGEQDGVLQERVLLININTAGEAELTTLPGVGSSKARSIIAYREKNGAYHKIEDIMNVEGIKDGVFQKIKDSITV